MTLAVVYTAQLCINVHSSEHVITVSQQLQSYC